MIHIPPPHGVILKAHCGIYDIYETKQVRFPKSKKKRIRNKWKKQAKNNKLLFIKYATLWVGETLFISEKAFNDFVASHKADSRNDMTFIINNFL